MLTILLWLRRTPQSHGHVLLVADFQGRNMIWHKLLARTPSTIRRMLSGSPCPPGGCSALELTELEDRILMSATPLAPDALADADVDEPVEAHDTSGAGTDASVSAQPPAVHDVSDALLPDPATGHELWGDVDLPAADRHEVAFVDTSVDGYEELLAHLVDQPDAADHLDVVLLDSHEDGIEQITRTLEQYDQLDAIHFLSHGTDGSVKLGNTWLDAERLHGYAGMIAGWSDALSSDADILFYSCDLASSPDGLAMLEGLHALTGADVAASVDATGHADLGGDWDLEYHLGSVEAHALLTPEARGEWLHVMSSTYVRDNFDSHDYIGNDGLANWSDGWHEIGESDDSSAGEVHIVDADLGVGDHHWLHLNPVDGFGAYRSVDLSLATSATLSFGYERATSGSHALNIEVSSDGGLNWANLDTISAGTDVGMVTASHDLTSYMSANTQVRFIVSGNGSGSLYLDFVQVEYETTGGLGYLPGNNAPVLNNGAPLTLTDILEDHFDNAGNTVASILGSAGDDRVTDLDPSALEGIAVTSVDNAHGQWQYDANADGIWLGFGTVTDHSAVLLSANSLVRFVPAADFAGAAGPIQFRAWDQTTGWVGETGCDVSVNGSEYAFSAATDTANITIQAVNDAPQLTVPANLSVNEDTELAVGGISVTDVDSGASDLQVTLSVGHGQLTLGDTTGLTFSTGDGTADPTLVFTGSLTDINAALATLKYQADLHYNGADCGEPGGERPGQHRQRWNARGQRQYWPHDPGGQRLRRSSPCPANLSVNEDTELAVGGISVADVDSGASDLQVTLSVGHGRLTLGDTTGLTFSTGDGTADPTLVFTGSLTDINAALATLKYQGDLHYNGADAVNVAVSDLGQHRQRWNARGQRQYWPHDPGGQRCAAARGAHKPECK